MKCENRTLTETEYNRVMSFSKEYLDEIGFGAGRYEVTYGDGEVKIMRIKKMGVDVGGEKIRMNLNKNLE